MLGRDLGVLTTVLGLLLLIWAPGIGVKLWHRVRIRIRDEVKFRFRVRDKVRDRVRVKLVAGQGRLHGVLKEESQQPAVPIIHSYLEVVVLC